MIASDSSDNSARPPRRPRYKGTHPRDYEQKYKEHSLAAYPGMEAHLRAKGVTIAALCEIREDRLKKALDDYQGELGYPIQPFADSGKLLSSGSDWLPITRKRAALT